MKIFSQIQKGWWLFGSSIGSGYYGASTNENTSGGFPGSTKTKTTSFGIGLFPNFGYFIQDKLAIGATLGLNYYYGKNTTSSYPGYYKYHSENFSIGPYLRYYFNGKKLIPFTEIFTGIGVGPSNSESSNGSTISKSSGTYTSWNAGFNAGLANFIATNIAMQFYVGYSYNHSKNESKFSGTTQTSKGNSSYINFGVGFQLHKPGKRSK